MVTIRGHFRLPQHRFAGSFAVGPAQAPRDRWLHPHRNEVTEIIPLDGFGDLGELDDLDFADLDEQDFGGDYDFDIEAHLLQAPELDDLHDADDLTPQPLGAPPAVLAE